MKDITIKKDGIYIRVYYKGQHMWTENTKYPLRSYGATKFRKYVKESDDYVFQNPKDRKMFMNTHSPDGREEIYVR